VVVVVAFVRFISGGVPDYPTFSNAAATKDTKRHYFQPSITSSNLGRNLAYRFQYDVRYE
jgi:hypothetical protein